MHLTNGLTMEYSHRLGLRQHKHKDNNGLLATPSS
ncbi:hypothetical protein A2U01_0083635, partial [Trifolium medium]|nr:hypothetical protein [Trifolium medium]